MLRITHPRRKTLRNPAMLEHLVDRAPAGAIPIEPIP